MDEPVILLRNISKCYDLFKAPSDRLRHLLFPKWSNVGKFWALKNIDLEVGSGATVGIIGRNGSGKSTLLQIVAGTMTPTTGTIQKIGRVSALLELGSGFNPEFTGRQNVFFNGRLLGLTQDEIEERFDQIAGFADIGEFLNYPVKTYSSGMVIRLAFSVAISVNPQILIIDEALAVGDARFQQKCMGRIKRLRDSGVSILFVSHDSEAVKRLCDHAVVLERGEIVNQGSPVHMANWYLSLMSVNFDLEKQQAVEKAAMARRSFVEQDDVDAEEPTEDESLREPERDVLSSTAVHNALFHSSDLSVEEDPELSAAGFGDDFRYYRHGDGAARVIKVLIYDSKGQPTDTVSLGETMSIQVYVDFLSDQEEHVLGISLRDRLGTDIIDLNTYQEKVPIAPVHTGDRCVYQFTFRIDARPGVYGLTVGLAYTQFEMRYLDWIENIKILRVSDPEPARIVFGVYLPQLRKILFKNAGRAALASSSYSSAGKVR
jgi:lipopolysaccharide transport system ATP-binding protein